MKPLSFDHRLKRRTRGIAWVSALLGYCVTFGVVMALIYVLCLVAYYLPQALLFQVKGQVLLSLLIGLPLAVAATLLILSRRDSRRLTQVLERRYPQLRDRLTTVVELGRSPAQFTNDPFSRLLVQGLEGQMNTLMDRFGFRRAFSFRRLLTPFALVMFLAITVTGHCLLQHDFIPTSYGRLQDGFHPALFLPGLEQKPHLPVFKIEVVPGDCKIAKGSNLVVKARTVDYEPKLVELYVKSSQGSAWQVFPMTLREGGEYQFLLSHIAQASNYFVKADHGESDLFKVELTSPLAVEEALWEVEFPEYLKLAPERKIGWRGKMIVPQGSKAHLRLLLNHPISSGKIVTGEGEVFELEKDSKVPGRLSAVLDCDKDRILTLDIRDEKGEVLMGVPSLLIQTVADLPPYLEVLEPQLQNSVFPTEEVPIVLSVNDDHGLRSVTLVLQYHNAQERIELLPEKDQLAKEITLKPVLELERFPLHSPDIIFAYFEVKDNFPNQATHLIRSELFTFMLRHYVEYFNLHSPQTDQPYLRGLFEDILIEQEKIVQSTWDYVSKMPEESVSEAVGVAS